MHGVKWRQRVFHFPGIYIRQCILEYNKLTFSQLMRFHSSLQDYFQREDGGIIREVHGGPYQVCTVGC